MHKEYTVLAVVGEFNEGAECPAELVRIIHACLPELPVIAMVPESIPHTEYIHSTDAPLLQLPSVLQQVAVTWK